MANRWTAEEEQFLKFAYVNKEFSTKEIAIELGKSKGSVLSKASLMGLKKEREVLSEGYKRCCRCGIIFPFESFYKQKTSKDNYSPRCKACDRERRLKDIKDGNAIKDGNVIKDMITKKCPKCNDIKSANEFAKNNRRCDGLASYCKICDREVKRMSRIKKMKERGW